MSHLQNVPVSEIAVDGGSLLCCLCERTELLLLNLLSHNGPPCRSGSSVCGLPTSLCDDAVAPLWAFLFFFMLLCLGLDSQV